MNITEVNHMLLSVSQTTPCRELPELAGRRSNRKVCVYVCVLVVWGGLYFNNSDSLCKEHNYLHVPFYTAATATDLKIECCTASNQRL